MPTMRLKYIYSKFIIIMNREIAIPSRNIPHIWCKHNIAIFKYNTYLCMEYVWHIFIILTDDKV